MSEQHSQLCSLILETQYSSVEQRLFVRCSFYLRILPQLFHCWFPTSFWVWWQAAWRSAGAAGHQAGSCGVSVSAASWVAATQPVHHATCAPAAAVRARTTVWPRSRHTHQSTGPPTGPPVPQSMVLIRMWSCPLFRRFGLVQKRTICWLGAKYAVAVNIQYTFTTSIWAKLLTCRLHLHSLSTWSCQKEVARPQQMRGRQQLCHLAHPLILLTVLTSHLKV